MTRTYPVCDRGELLRNGFGFLLIGGFIVLVLVLSPIGLSPSPFVDVGSGGGLIWLFTVWGFGYGVCLGWEHLVHRTWLITVDPSGVLVFHRAFRVSRINAGNLRHIERRLRRMEIDGEDSRLLEIQHRTWTIPVSYFPTVEAFLADIQNLSHRVSISGSWDSKPDT